MLAGLLVVDGKDYSQEITFRQLITHRSGLPNTDNSLSFQYWVLSERDRARRPSELIEFARGMTPVGKPDQTMGYSSVGYFLLGLAIQGVTGEPYHQVVRRELFDPLGMTDTYESNHELPAELKTSHHYFGPFNLVEDTDPSFEFADGGLVTTAEDLMKLGRAIIQESIFKNDETRRIFSTPLKNGSGFGYFWGQTPGNVKFLFQPGFWGVRFAVFPEQKIVVVFTLNQSNTLAQKFLRQSITLLSEGGHL
jgi:D-alanyl-D-alanine carboxypeptidase